MVHAEIEESNHHLREFWKLYTQVSLGGEVFDQGGLSIANAKQPWFFMNVAMLNRPSINQADLKRRAQEAQEHFRSGEHPWVLTASEDWFGFNSESILASIGLVHKLELLGMLAERLSPPTRRLPEVQLRWISDEETPFALADLNADVYERPQGVGEASAGLRCALARTAIRTNRLRRRRARLGRVYPANR